MNEEELAREIGALEEFGRKRAQLSRKVFWTCAVVGGVVGLLGIYLVMNQLLSTQGQASISGSVIVGFGIPFALSLVISRFISRSMIQTHSAHWLQQISIQYEIPVERLIDAARQANKLD